jgi:hypothetical protein
MDKLELKLVEIMETLEKALAMPSPKGPKLPGMPKIDAPQLPKQPSLVPGSKKDPVKVAQQVEDPDQKAQALNMAKEKLKLAKNGQWSLEKQFPVPIQP